MDPYAQPQQGAARRERRAKSPVESSGGSCNHVFALVRAAARLLLPCSNVTDVFNEGSAMRWIASAISGARDAFCLEDARRVATRVQNNWRRKLLDLNTVAHANLRRPNEWIVVRAAA